tara:strand:- start:40 stop:639 length:600 start_codon:yes stop_codon:yes gene_type:complete
MSNQEQMKLVEELSKDMTIDKESRDALKWILKEEEKCEICDRNAYHKNDWHCSQGKTKEVEEEECWTCGDTDVKHKTYRDALGEYELTCDKCHRIEYPEEYEEEEEFNYCNCGIEKKPLFGKISYMVAGGGLGNGNAYATVEFIPKGKKDTDDQYYYCEYGNNPTVEYLGKSIIWSDEIYDKENPYCNRNFKVIDDYEE